MGNIQPPARAGEKQSRAFGKGRSVRLIDPFDRLVGVIRGSEAVARHLGAPNAEPIRDRSGAVRAIRLASFGDDRGQPGERHGSSLITTQRCRNEESQFIGGLLRTGQPAVIRHKLDTSDKG